MNLKRLRMCTTCVAWHAVFISHTLEIGLPPDISSYPSLFSIIYIIRFTEIRKHQPSNPQTNTTSRDVVTGHALHITFATHRHSTFFADVFGGALSGLHLPSPAISHSNQFYPIKHARSHPATSSLRKRSAQLHAHLPSHFFRHPKHPSTPFPPTFCKKIRKQDQHTDRKKYFRKTSCNTLFQL